MKLTDAVGGESIARPGLGAGRIVPLVFLMAYLAGSWFPFRLDLPRTEPNGLVVTDDGTWRFSSVGLAMTPDAPLWLPTAISEQHVVVRLEARSRDPDQQGPARLLTVSRDHQRHNLMIGQDGPDLVIRIARHGADLRGEPELRVPEVFRTREWRTIDLEAGAGIHARVDGESVLDIPRAAVFDAWDPNHRLALGNELSGWRPWSGELRTAIVQTEVGPTDLLRDGATVRPSKITLLPESHYEPNADRAASMAVAIWALHVGVGAVAGLIAIGLRLSAARALTTWLILCLVANLLKFVIDGRHVSFLTVGLQLFGGMAGIALAGRWCAERVRVAVWR